MRHWVSVLGAFKLDHLQPVELILFQQISAFLIFILGSPILYYPRAEYEKKGFTQKLIRHGGRVSVLGAFKLDHLQPVKQILLHNFSNFLIFILGSPFLITPESGK